MKTYTTRPRRSEEIRGEIGEALELVSDIVCSTMGPGGRNVTLHSDAGISTTKDGVTVARHLNLEGGVANAVGLLAVDAAYRTVKEVGDGTTTSILMLKTLYKNLEDLTADRGLNLFAVGRGVDMAVDHVKGCLHGMALPVKDSDGGIDKALLRDVSVISANNDEILGRMISDLVYQVGENGIVEVKDSIDGSTYAVKTDGYVFNTIALKQFVPVGQSHVELVNPVIMIIDMQLSDYDQIRDIVQTWNVNCKDGNGKLRPLVLIVSDIEGSALATMTINSRTMPICVVKSPGFGLVRRDLLEDIQVVTDTRQVFNNTTGHTLDRFGYGLNGKKEMEFGRADKVIVYKDKVIISNDKEMKRWNTEQTVVELVERLKVMASECEGEQERGWIRERISRLTSGVGTIYVGADSELELGFKRMVIDDAQRACFSALDGGVVIGGGQALLKCYASLQELIDTMDAHGDEAEMIGALAVLRSLSAPIRMIMRNLFMGEASVVMLNEISKSGGDKAFMGWDFMSFEDGNGDVRGNFVNMLTAGIVDPVKVTVSALKNAASVAKQLLTTEWFLFLESNKDMDLGKIFYPER